MEYNGGALEEMFIMIKLIKIAQERHGKKYAESLLPLHYEDIYETYLNVLDRMDELVCYKYYEDSDVTLYKFVTAKMTEYFHLAYEYGELKGFKEDENPYFKNALSRLRDTVGEIRSYCYNYRLYTSKSRNSRLYFLTDPEYWMPIDTFEELYAFFDYFTANVGALKSEVEKIRPKSIKRGKRTVKNKQSRRKAA